ncbi:hypothetical protein L195_g032177, partial [Trifolium pratense]
RFAPILTIMVGLSSSYIVMNSPSHFGLSNLVLTSSGSVIEEKSFPVVLEYLLRALLSARIVTTLSFISWYLIFRCTVEGTAPNESRAGLLKIQLYVVLHGTKRNLIWIARIDDGSLLSLKVVGTVMIPNGRVTVPSNTMSGRSLYGDNSDVWLLSFENRFWYMMLQELPWLEMLCLVIVAVMSSGRSLLGIPSTRSQTTPLNWWFRNDDLA